MNKRDREIAELKEQIAKALATEKKWLNFFYQLSDIEFENRYGSKEREFESKAENSAGLMRRAREYMAEFEVNGNISKLKKAMWELRADRDVSIEAMRNVAKRKVVDVVCGLQESIDGHRRDIEKQVDKRNKALAVLKDLDSGKYDNPPEAPEALPEKRRNHEDEGGEVKPQALLKALEEAGEKVEDVPVDAGTELVRKLRTMDTGDGDGDDK